MHHPRLRAVATGGIRPLRDLLAEMPRGAADAGRLAAGRGPDTEAMALICLADGVTHCALLDALTVDEGRDLVERHLAGLFVTP